jgi:acyl-coenzyme A synthetase/AMP-(fatty) acid ligase
MTVELVISMLASARLGAIHSVVFAGFSSDALAERMIDAECKILVTADGVYRGKKFIPLKEISDEAVDKCLRLNHKIKNVIVYHHLKCPVRAANMTNGSGNHHSMTNGSTNGVMTNGFAIESLHTLNGVSKQNGSLSNGVSLNVAPQLNGSINSSSSNGFTELKQNGYTNGFTNGSLSNGTTNGKTTNGEAREDYPEIPWDPEIDVWWHEVLSTASDQCEPVWVDAEHKLFYLYTR